ncbi:MAG: hypothetical protein R3236_11925, partial [Phycisphaeraceae bacterium]|nr:hypothetical protein [Phycisphaeraceae bacterium]
MSRSDERVAALVPAIGSMGPDQGGPDKPFGGTTVLGHTLRRLAACDGLDRLILLAPQDWQPQADWDRTVQKKLTIHTCARWQEDPLRSWRRAARKWAPTSWRG